MAMRSGRASFPRAMRSAPPAAIATAPACRRAWKSPRKKAIGDGPEEIRNQVRRQRKFGAEVIKVCATGGVFSLGNTERRRSSSSVEAKSAPSPTRRTCGACGSPPTRTAPTASTPRSAPGSTPSSMPAWPTPKRSASPSSARAGVVRRWISTTPNIPRPRARRTARSRTISQGSRDRPRPSATTSAQRTRAGVRMMFGTRRRGVCRTARSARQFPRWSHTA